MPDEVLLNHGGMLSPLQLKQTTMKFLATENHNIRTTRGQYIRLVKGQVVSQTVAKHFFKNGKAPDFLKKYAPSHIERFLVGREDLLRGAGFESDVDLAVYKGIFYAHNGDSERFKFMKNGQRAKAISLGRQVIKEFGLTPVDFVHGMTDPLVEKNVVWTQIWPLTKDQEQKVIARVVEIESAK